MTKMAEKQTQQRTVSQTTEAQETITALRE